MDRFFSKLDLRDIKIDPFKTSFPPDAEEESQGEEPAATAVDAAPPIDRAERRPYVPAWAGAGAAADPIAGEEEAIAVGEAVVAHEAVVLNGAAVSNGGANGHATYASPAPAVVDGLDTTGDVLKVSARSRPSAVAGAIAGVVREMGRAEVQAIGAGATNQAVKAVAIARDYLRETGIEAVCLPAFIDITIENEDRTAIRLVVEPR